MTFGYSLDDVGPLISHTDVWALLNHLARVPTSAVFFVLNGNAWGQSDYLLAAVFDRLGQLAATNVRIAGGKPRKLEPYPRPKPKNRATARNITPMPVSEVLAWAAENEGAPE